MLTPGGGDRKVFLTLANLGLAVTSGAWADDGMKWGHRGMFMAGPDGTMFALFGLFCIVTWILVIALLVVLIRYFWKLADKIK